jgi:protein SCO1/2
MSTSTDSKPKRERPPPLLIAAAIIAILLIGAGVWMALSNNKPAGLTAASVGGPFALQDGNGRTVTDRDLRGRWLLVYFGYTSCPDACPTTLTEVATAMDKLGEHADQVQPVFISVDPQRDTPQVVKDYVAAFTPKLLGLTGTPEQVAQVAREYRVYYAIHRSGGGPGDYSVDHSSLLYLMGPDGRFVAPIRADESGEAIAADIAKYVEPQNISKG